MYWDWLCSGVLQMRANYPGPYHNLKVSWNFDLALVRYLIDSINALLLVSAAQSRFFDMVIHFLHPLR